MALLFSKTEMQLGKGVVVLPNHRIPEEALKPGAAEELVARGLAVWGDGAKPAPAPQAPPETVHNSEWAFDPAGLATDTLDVLNMKIAGHVEKYGLAAVAPFEDAEEARTFMSLAWQKD